MRSPYHTNIFAIGVCVCVSHFLKFHKGKEELWGEPQETITLWIHLKTVWSFASLKVQEIVLHLFIKRVIFIFCRGYISVLESMLHYRYCVVVRSLWRMPKVILAKLHSKQQQSFGQTPLWEEVQLCIQMATCVPVCNFMWSAIGQDLKWD